MPNVLNAVKRLPADATEAVHVLRESRERPGAKTIPTQLREMTHLRRGPTKLSPLEYLRYELFDERLHPGVDLDAVCGSRMRNMLHRSLNDPAWDASVTDKLIMALLFRIAKIPQPQLHAAFTKYDRTCADIPVLRVRDEFEAYFDGMPAPCFVKPIKGGSGAGCHRVDPIGGGHLRVDNGASCTARQIVDQLYDPTGWGFLVQEAMEPSEATTPLVGEVVTGLRVVVLLGDDGPQLFRAIWKIPAAGKVTDNFGVGDRGTAAAVVDVSSGVVEHIDWGTGRRMSSNDLHPVTGVDLLGIRIPMWDDVVDIVRAAALAFPGFRFQHWDVGLTSHGPVAFELNSNGDLFDGDLRGCPGTYDDVLRAFLSRYGRNR